MANENGKNFCMMSFFYYLIWFLFVGLQLFDMGYLLTIKSRA